MSSTPLQNSAESIESSMRNRRLLTTSIVLFVLAQVTWFSLLGLFVYRFVMSRNLAEQVEGQLSIAMDSTGSSLLVLIFGCLLYVAVSVAMSIIFKNLGSQLRLTSMYDTFIANITHELKSPLASLQLYLETFKLRNVPHEKQAEFIDLMLNDSTRLKNLINSILKIAVLEKKKEIFEFSIVNVEHLVRRLIVDLQQQFKWLPGAITLSGSAPCECVIDENALKIVLNNLIENALKYSNEPVKMVISLRLGAKNVQISFQDNGIGIPVKEQKRIFQKFYRIINDRVPNVKGTGLGLYWVREIIRHHGGSITVNSQGYGSGSTFVIQLPIYQAAKTRYLKRLLKWTKQHKENQVFDDRVDDPAKK